MQKKRSPALSPRLAAVAGFIRQGSVVADIGADHAYLPVWAVMHGISPRAVASDIGEGPASRAKETVAKYGLEDRVEVVVANGLDGIDLSAVDDVVIAGMGGSTIISVLTAAPPVPYLILQPQSDLPQIRTFLSEKGYAFTERVVAEGEKIYNVFRASYTGRPYELDAYGTLVGRPDGEVGIYMTRLAVSAKKRLAGLEAAVKRDEKELALARRLTELLEDGERRYTE